MYSLFERIHKIKCQNERGNRKYETYGIKYKNYDYFLEYKL